MTARRISIKKAVLSNVFEALRAAVTEAEARLDSWKEWPTAQTAYRARIEHQKVLHNRAILRDMENMVSGKGEGRVRKLRADSTGGSLEKQTSRLRLVVCPECEYKARITSMWIEIGIPKCPNPDCGSFDQVMSQEFGTKQGEESEIVLLTDPPTQLSPEMTENDVEFFKKAGML